MSHRKNPIPTPVRGVVGGGNPSSGSGFQPAEGRQTTVKTTTCAHPFAAR